MTPRIVGVSIKPWEQHTQLGDLTIFLKKYVKKQAKRRKKEAKKHHCVVLEIRFCFVVLVFYNCT